MSKYVFVYGTLRTGDCRAGVLGNQGLVCEEAYVEGFQLLDIGSFPGVVKGDGRVRGEMHEIDDQTLGILDSIEGYHEDAPEHSLYVREVVPVLNSEGEPAGEAWIYIYNANLRARHRLPPTIESGDWFEHRGLYDGESNA